MTDNVIKRIIYLLLLGLLLGFIWRIEVEYYGWEGLIWLGYSHASIRIGGLLFALWLWLSTRKLINKSVKLSLIFILWGMVAISILYIVSYSYFVIGPLAFMNLLTFGSAFLVMKTVAPFVWSLTILTLYWIYSKFFKFPLLVGFIGFLIWTFSWHLGLLIISVIPENGWPDLLHSLKTGWMIPFSVLGVGLPIAFIESNQKKMNDSEKQE